MLSMLRNAKNGPQTIGFLMECVKPIVPITEHHILCDNVNKQYKGKLE